MSSINEEIKSIFAELLESGDIDNDSLFIELGGQSMMMGILQNELRDRYGVVVPFEVMYESGSVNGLSDYVTGHRDNIIHGYGDVDFTPEPEKRYEKFPLTDFQTAYYVGRQKDTELGGNPTRGYSEIICTSYEHDRMEKAVNRLFAVHDAFRLRFNEDITQQVEPEFGYYTLSEDDITGMPEKEQQSFIAEKRERIFNDLFDIYKLPLVRFEATKITADKAVIHFSHDGLIIDGWSHERIIHDLDTLYADPSAEIKVPELLFRDYVNYLEKVKETPKYKEDMEYWLSRGLDKYERPALPLKCEPEQVKDVISRQVIRYISADIWEGVKNYAAENGLTPFSLLITAYGKSLLKYSSNNNFLISIPASIRPDICDDIGGLIGECSNFFVCGFDNEKDKSILDTAYANQKQIFEVMQHNSFMGTDYIREMQKKSGANIIAPIVFTSIIDTPEQENKYLTKIYTKTHTSQIWIDAIAMKNGDGIMLIMDCTSAMFDEDTTDGIGDTFVKMLEMYAAKDSYIEEKSYAPLLEREYSVISDCITGDIDGEVPDLGELLYKAYEENKERPAVICNNAVTTYEQMYQEAYSTAMEIRKVTGLESRFGVGLFMDKCKYQPIASIAATLINCPFMPLDIQYSIDHIAYCVKNADIKVIVTDNMFYDTLDGKVDCKLINIEKINFSYDNVIHFEPAEPTDSAFIINTSGTTGKPKSVDLKRDGLVNCVEETRIRFGLDRNERIFAITNYCHDMSVYDIYGAFTLGGAMVIPDHDKQKDPRHWLYLIKNYGITFWNSVPSFHEMLVEADIENTPDYLDSVKHILSGGESMKITLAERVMHNFRNAELNNVGGPAEATIWSIWHRVVKEDIDNELIPYGKPLKNQRYYVLSDMMSLCPPGVEGTLFIAGIGVAKGYLGLKEATDKSFVEFDGVRVYNTGDRGLYLPDGSIKFLGRRDSQIKINGKRIELEGIAQNIMQFPGVSLCAVVFCKSSNALVAFFTGESSADTKVILRELRKRLPDYMVPSEMLHISAIPVTKNGKTDVTALESIYNEHRAVSGGQKVEYSSELETEVSGICAEILKREVISPEDNFYEIGGNSISAIKIISALKNRYKVSVTIYDILNSQCVRDWCRIIEDRLAENNDGNDERITVQAIPESMPLTDVQKGMWFQAKSKEMSDNANTFILCGSVFIRTEDFDAERFTKALNRSIAENAVLRTQIADDGIKPYQVFRDVFEYTPDFNEYDLPHDEAVKEAEGRVLRDKITLDGFPLFAVEVSRCNDGFTAVTIGIHHIISDIYTLELMFAEIDRYYSENTEISCDTASSDKLKFSDYVLWQNKMIEQGHYDDDIAYWTEKLRDMPMLDLSDGTAGWDNSGSEMMQSDLTEEELYKFKELCRNSKYSAFAGIAAVVAIAVRYYLYTDRVTLGMAYSGRSRADIENLMGCMAVSTVLDTEISAADSFETVLTKTQQSLNNTFEHTSMPFSFFVEKAGADRKYAMLPYSIMLNEVNSDYISMENFSGMRFAMADVAVDIMVVTEFSSQKSSLSFSYLKTKFGKEFMDEFNSVVSDIIRMVIEDKTITAETIEKKLDE